ncbi:hypothetical protein GCM10022245_09520 [Streptomyces mayteni]
MPNFIVWIFEPLMRWLVPASGRHRLTDVPPGPACMRGDMPTVPLGRVRSSVRPAVRGVGVAS